ncbi:MAG: rod shape-determining protein MreC [Bacteroidia bacterium]|nr:rod shape-determining protein MreC [Bacteroidia bacterium]
MRNLLLFISKYHYFFLFILLELIAFILLIQGNSFHRSSFINSTNSMSGNVYRKFSDITEYFRLKDINDKLVLENSVLRNELRSSHFGIAGPRDTVKDTVYHQRYLYVPAKVVNITTHRQNNYLTINRGSAHGVKKGMGVVCGQGVVGIVKDVSDHFSSVMMVLHTKVLIPSMVKKYREPGILHWEGTHPEKALLPNIPRHLSLRVGDTITTSSSSSIFAEGTMVGMISGISEVSGNTFYEVEVKLSVDFRKLTYVYVVNYLFKEEQDHLEKISQDDQ